ncbi:MAG: thiamine pyrophosphate-binding protein [SAR324 cluster bacterium]|nr:thiamine pyrophosphate-binding protein [SAR324 cluster bacterium]
MAQMTGARAVTATLGSEGIKHVFGIVGTHNTPLYDALIDEPSIRPITVRHEQGAAMMAAGYARASGQIAACFVVPGPGLTNALTGMGMAYSESAPMIVIAGQNNYDQLEREGGHFHELNHSLQVASSVCAYTARVASPDAVPQTVREALRSIRSQRPRPVFIEMPLDVQSGEADVTIFPPELLARPSGDPNSILRAIETLKSAKRPFIYAGGGVESADATRELATLAEALGAPVVSNVFGRGAISDRHPLAMGDGWGRLNLYDDFLREADLAIVVGSRLDVVSDVNTGAGFPERQIQIDIDPLVLGQRRPTDLGIVGDARSILSAIASGISESARPCWFDVEKFREGKRRFLEQRCPAAMKVIDDLRAVLPDNAIVVDDLTLIGYWMPVVLDTYLPRTLIHPGTYGTLGYSLPAAIGAKIACPDQPVISISGDGGFLFTLQELSTARAENLDLISIVFNDNAFGAINTFQDRVFGNRHIGSELVNPDFVKLGAAFGANSVRIGADELGTTVRQALTEGGLWLIEVPFTPADGSRLVPWMP